MNTIINRTKYVNYCNGVTPEVKMGSSPKTPSVKVIKRSDCDDKYYKTAQKHFGSVENMTVLNEEGILSIQQMAEKTKDAIERGVETMYLATFAGDNCFTIVDILHREENGFSLNMIFNGCGRASRYPGLAYDKWILEQCGVQVSSVNIITTRTSRDGNPIIKIYDVTQDIEEEFQKVADNIDKMRKGDSISQV